MKLILLRALSVFTVGIVVFSLQTQAAILQMKGGQKVEGEYIGGSRNEVHIAVGSQILKFKIKEVDAIIFNTSTNLSSQDSKKYDFAKAAKEILRILKGLNSVVEAGTTYEDYSPRVSDANIKVNEFLEEYKDINPKFNQHITDAIGYYTAAAKAWNFHLIARTLGIEYSIYAEEVASDPYIRKCQDFQMEMEKYVRNKLSEPGNLGESREGRENSYKGFFIEESGIPILWNCAQSEINQAEVILFYLKK